MTRDELRSIKLSTLMYDGLLRKVDGIFYNFYYHCQMKVASLFGIYETCYCVHNKQITQRKQILTYFFTVLDDIVVCINLHF